MGDVAIIRGKDGALYLVGEVDGAKHVFGEVNASQVSADRIEQGLDAALENASTNYLGGYTGPPEDITPSPHLEGSPASSSSPSSPPSSDQPSDTATAEQPAG